MPNARNHKMPKVSKEAKEAENIARQMYASLTADGAPKATPTGYVIGACLTLKLLYDQASQQVADKGELKETIIKFVQDI